MHHQTSTHIQGYLREYQMDIMPVAPEDIIKACVMPAGINLPFITNQSTDFHEELTGCLPLQHTLLAHNTVSH